MTKLILLSLSALSLIVIAESMGVFFPIGGQSGSNEEPCDCEEDEPRRTKSARTTTTTTPTTTTPSTTTKPPIVTCPNVNDGHNEYILFERTPSAANDNTQWWCLTARTYSLPMAPNTANSLCQSISSGGGLSNFENDNETTTTLALVSSYVRPKFSIIVAGQRNATCMTNATKSLCGDETFYQTDNHTDFSYVNQNWYTGQPDGTNMIYQGNFIIEACLAIYVKPAEYAGKYNDVFCNYAVSPWYSDPLYQSYGMVCGAAPTITPQ